MAEDPMQVDKQPEAEDLSGDGGVMKTIIKEGEGWERPQRGADVEVHYTGTLLDGTKFDSSLDRGQPFKFQVDSGTVIKGWDIAVKSMKKGEKAKFVLKPDYAYGSAGSPPKIPPDATLVFEIELLHFSNEKDITKDGGVLKRTVKDPKEKYGPSPSFESKCKVRIVGKLPDGKEFQNEEIEVVIGDENVVTGVEKAIESLKVGEVANFVIKPKYAYGSEGCPEKGIPPDATLHYQIELLELKKEKEYWEYNSFEEKHEAAALRKQQGNELYAKGKYERANKKYKRAVDFLEYLGSGVTDEEKAKANAIKLGCYLNMAQCQLKLREYNKVIEHCNKALEIDKRNVKAYYRRALAYFNKVDWEAAGADFKKALELEPDNKDVIREYNRLKQTMREQDAKDKKIFAKLFS